MNGGMIMPSSVGWILAHIRTLAVAVALVLTVALVLFPTFCPTSVHAAQITDVLSLDTKRKIPTFKLDVQTAQTWTSGQIQREYHCTNRKPDGSVIRPGMDGYDPNCPFEPRILSANELDYKRSSTTMDITARLGVWKNLELGILVPLVLHDTESMDFFSQGSGSNNLVQVKPYCRPGDRNCSLSSIYREDAEGNPSVDYSLFALPATGPTRAGFGDMIFSLAWTPYNQKSDATAATWLLKVDWLAPTGKLMKPDNSHVGKGLHELTLWTVMSRRFASTDPYLGMFYTRVIPSEDSPFQRYAEGQTLVKPGDRFGLLFGSELIPWEDTANHRKLAIDLGGKFVYQFEGRDYSPLWAFLGNSPCSQSDTCALTRIGELRSPDLPNAPLRSDGITDMEQYGIVSAWLGVVMHASRYFKLDIHGQTDYSFDHFLTNASAGIDNGLVITHINPDTQLEEYEYRPGRIDPYTEEVNPVFNSNLDPIGKRLRIVQNWNISLWLTATVNF